MRILVVGAGIGGLAAANALRRSGHDVVVVEAASTLEPIGAGIVMAPNATHVLDRLGVDLSVVGQALRSLDVVDARGRLLTRLDAAGNAPRFGPTWAVTRPELHNALAEALPDGVDLRLGQGVDGIDVHDDRVEVSVAGSSETVDVLVGADGLNSTVRTAVHGELPLRYSGTTCWRGICPDPGFDRAIESWDGATRIGVVPLSEGRLYYYLVADAPPRSPELGWPEEMRERFAEHAGQVASLWDALDESPSLHHDLNELESPVWGSGRVFLLGDAAHAMTPNQGQGAAMAIEDAYALAQVLSPDIELSRAEYVASRHRRVRKVQLMSRRIGAAAHWRSPVARALRDAALRATPVRASQAQLRSLVGPGISLASVPLASDGGPGGSEET